MNFDESRKARLKLAYQVGSLEGFLKYGLGALSTITIKDQAGFEAAVEAAIARIEKESEKYANEA